MSNDDKIPESVLRSINDAQEAYNRVRQSLNGVISKIPIIDDSKFEQSKLGNFTETVISSDVIREQNAWERHKEILEVQNSVLGIQSGILQEQKANSRISNWILALAVISCIVAIISLIVVILK